MSLGKNQNRWMNQISMLKGILLDRLNVSLLQEKEVKSDDRRLLVAAIPVLSILAFIFLPDPAMGRWNADWSRLNGKQKQAMQSEIYPVLVDQLEKPEAKTRQVRALSDAHVEGKGGLTEKKGFHTLTAYDEFRPGDQQTFSKSSSSRISSNQRVQAEKLDQAEEGQIPPESVQKNNQEGRTNVPEQKSSRQYKIPANYRFRQDFLFRYDSGPQTAVATRKLAGFQYFQGMLRQIRESFAPPGLNFAYRDHAGTVINQPIKPQTVQVLFYLDETGYVRDVRVVSSMGQAAVDRACVDVLDGQNFGPPPPEIFEQGNIFGINFIFPPVGR